jgi:hypothetical protein
MPEHFETIYIIEEYWFLQFGQLRRVKIHLKPCKFTCQMDFALISIVFIHWVVIYMGDQHGHKNYPYFIHQPPKMLRKNNRYTSK